MRFDKKSIEEMTEGIGWSDEVRGLGIRVSGSTKTFIMKYRLDGVQRWMSFGRYGEITITKALRKAAEAREKLTNGEDPSQPRMKGDKVADLILRYRRDCLPALKPKSQHRYESILQFIEKELGHMKTKDLRDAHAMQLQCTCRAKYSGGTTNSTMSVLSRLMVQAEKWGYRRKATNPCYHIQKMPATKRDRFLTLDEITKLEKALADPALNLYGAACILMLLYTGARYDEIRTARWTQVNLEIGTLLVPKIANKRPVDKVVTLNQRAISLLKSIRQDRSPFVFPSMRLHSYTDSVNYVWHKVRKDLELGDVHLHDLRHTYATILLSEGASLDSIAPMLGQQSSKSAQIYAHLFDEARQKLAGKIDSYLTPETNDAN